MGNIAAQRQQMRGQDDRIHGAQETHHMVTLIFCSIKTCRTRSAARKQHGVARNYSVPSHRRWTPKSKN